MKRKWQEGLRCVHLSYFCHANIYLKLVAEVGKYLNLFFCFLYLQLLAKLEKVRKMVEEETGEAASLSRWADAAGIDKKTLQQNLQFGWYCRDELLRSTRSLIMYLAKNYRSLGVAFDDLIQVGQRRW